MTTTPLPMDRDSVLERMIRVYVKSSGWNPDGHLFDDPEPIWKMYVADMKSALNASGLMERIAELEAELQKQKTEAIELVWNMGQVMRRKDAALRLTARWFALNADEFDGARKADSESVIAEIGNALSPPPSIPLSQPTNSPTDQPQREE